jgi:hypothetical protein
MCYTVTDPAFPCDSTSALRSQKTPAMWYELHTLRYLSVLE